LGRLPIAVVPSRQYGGVKNTVSNDNSLIVIKQL